MLQKDKFRTRAMSLPSLLFLFLYIRLRDSHYYVLTLSPDLIIIDRKKPIRRRKQTKSTKCKCKTTTTQKKKKERLVGPLIALQRRQMQAPITQKTTNKNVNRNTPLKKKNNIIKD